MNDQLQQLLEARETTLILTHEGRYVAIKLPDLSAATAAFQKALYALGGLDATQD